jgi:methylase of polypeptide subunit release factors
MLNPAEKAMVALAALLQEQGYSFTSVTPQTHLRVLNRLPRGDSNREVFGWNRPFQKAQLSPQIVQLLGAADAIEDIQGASRSRIRFSSLDGLLFCHSAFPTVDQDSVFFGPDSYRFAAAVGRFVRTLQRNSLAAVVDVGCGSGVGGIYLAKRFDLPAAKIYLADISQKALSMSRVSIAINGATGVDVQHSDVLACFPRNLDLVISNPPYLVDPKRRLYRDGGGEFGIELSLRIVAEAIEHLKPGGFLFLYTGTPVVDGVDLFREALSRLACSSLPIIYEELDPDVFGDELSSPSYNQADRIAVVSLIVQKT